MKKYYSHVINPAEDHLHTMLDHWEFLGTTPIDQNGNLARPFAQFEAGTPREDIIQIFADYNPEIFNPDAAAQGDFRTVLDKESNLRLSIEIECDARAQVEEFAFGGNDCEGLSHVADYQRETEIPLALDEIRKQLDSGLDNFRNYREFDETRFHVNLATEPDLETARGLKLKILDNLKELRGLISEHMIDGEDRVIVNQSLSPTCRLLNSLNNFADTVRDLEDYEVKTNQHTPMLIDVSLRNPQAASAEEQALVGRFEIAVPANLTDAQKAAVSMNALIAHADIASEDKANFNFRIIDGGRGVEIEPPSEQSLSDREGFIVNQIGRIGVLLDYQEESSSSQSAQSAHEREAE